VYKKPTQTNPIWTPVTTTTTERQIVLPPWDIKAMALCNLESLHADLNFFKHYFQTKWLEQWFYDFSVHKMTLAL